MSREYSDIELKRLIDDCIEELLRKIPVTQIDTKHLSAEVFNGRRRMGIIQPFFEDPTVNEIMINGTDGIFLEKDGTLVDSGVRYDSKEELFHNIQTMLAQSNRTVNEKKISL